MGKTSGQCKRACWLLCDGIIWGWEQTTLKAHFFEEQKGLSVLPSSMLFTKMYVYAYVCICTLINTGIGIQMWNDGNLSCW